MEKINKKISKKEKPKIRVINKIKNDIYHVFPKRDNKLIEENYYNNNNFCISRQYNEEINTLILQIFLLISLVIIILALIALIGIQTKELKEFRISNNKSDQHNIDNYSRKELLFKESEEEILARMKNELENTKKELDRMKSLLIQRKIELQKIKEELEDTNNSLYRMVKYSYLYQS